MAAQDWISLILLGGIMGMVGQGIRVIVGLKKLYDSALQEGKAFSNDFKGSTLLFSLLLGFVAGVLGVLSLPELIPSKIPPDKMLTLIGIGYAGADFIEGFIKKNTAQFSGATAGVPAGTDNAEQPPVG